MLPVANTLYTCYNKLRFRGLMINIYFSSKVIKILQSDKWLSLYLFSIPAQLRLGMNILRNKILPLATPGIYGRIRLLYSVCHSELYFSHISDSDLLINLSKICILFWFNSFQLICVFPLRCL